MGDEKKRDYWWLVFLASYFFLMAFQYTQDSIMGSDAYYHIKASEMIRKTGLIRDAPWLPYSRYHQDFPDYRWFFHFFLMPFTFGSLTAGAKNAAIFYGTLFFILFYELLKKNNISHPFIWFVLTLVGSATFLFRLSLTRPFLLSILFLITSIRFLFDKQYKLLAPLSFFYFWVYPPGAVPIIAVSVFYVISRIFVDGVRDCKPVYYVFIGLLLGAVVNPYFPAGIIAEVKVDYLFLFSGKINPAIEGAELRPFSSTDFFLVMPILIILSLASFTLQYASREKPESRVLTLFLVTGFFLPFTLRSQRFIEYFFPLGMLYCAFSIDALVKKKFIKNLVGKLGIRWKYVYPIILVFFLPTVYFSGVNAYSLNATPETPGLEVNLTGCATWLSENTPEYSVVFNTNWGDFTRLFFINPRNAYVVGLEPASLLMYNQSMYQSWIDISSGKIDDPAEIIIGQFNASYVVSAVGENITVLGKLENDARLSAVYEDGSCVVYETLSGLNNLPSNTLP